MIRAVEESVLVEAGIRTVEVYAETMMVMVRVVTRVKEMISLVNLEKVEDDNTVVIGVGLEKQGRGSRGDSKGGRNSGMRGHLLL